MQNLKVTYDFADWAGFEDRLAAFSTKSGKAVRVLIRHGEDPRFFDPAFQPGWMPTGHAGFWVHADDDWEGLLLECGLTLGDILEELAAVRGRVLLYDSVA